MKMKLAKIIRLIDSANPRVLINESGEESRRPIATYKSMTFGGIIGSHSYHRKFYKLSELEGEISFDWKYLHGMLNCRPICITMKELKKQIMKLLNNEVEKIYIYSKSLLLGLHGWSYCNPENGKKMREVFGEDTWIFSPSKPDEVDYKTVNKHLKSVGAKYRVKAKGTIVTKILNF